MNDASQFADNDIDPTETREWLDAIEDVIDRDGGDRAHYLLDRAVKIARENGANLPFGATTAYLNTIPADQQAPHPGDAELEWRIQHDQPLERHGDRGAAGNKVSSEYGGHIASFASSAVLYDIGLNHFWRSRTDDHGGDLVFFQGTRRARHLCARVHEGAHHRKTARQFPLRNAAARGYPATRIPG